MATAPSSCSADSASRRSCLSDTTTRAPSSAQRLAVAKPIPVPAAAVTSTVLPASSWRAGGYGGGSAAIGERLAELLVQLVDGPAAALVQGGRVVPALEHTDLAALRVEDA